MSERESDRPPGDPRPPAPFEEGEVERRVRGYLADEHRDEHGEWLSRLLYSAIRRICRNRGFSAAEARELTQNVLVRVFQNLDKYRFEAPFIVWVRRIAMNTLNNHERDQRTRRAKVREEPLELPVTSEAVGASVLPHPALRVEAEAEVNAQRAELGEVLEHALRELPPAMRRCLLMFAVGFTYQEIADALGISLNTVRWHISKGYGRLRPILEPYLPGYPAGEV